ncbi:MAG: response regulator transcription factor [Bacteroidetes bacterium]|nr:response regulator transcription factor [Bacteroidota bacterium]
METKVIIVDDEKRGITALQKLLEKYCTNISVAATADNIDNAEIAIRKFPPDLVFLDIEMPDGSGFNLLERFDSIDFHVIFVTAFQEYAIKAIKFSAFDYLLKPVKISELQETVRRAQTNINKKQSNALQSVITTANPFNKLMLATMEGYYLVKPEEVLYCKADDSYTHFYLQNGKHYIVSKPLKEFEQVLIPYNFFRIHKSFLVNMNHIELVNKLDGGITVVMNSKDQLPVSFRKKDEFIEKLRAI